MVEPLHVIGSKALQETLTVHEGLVAMAQSITAPRTPSDAAQWINDSPTKEVRNARKVLSHAMLYGAGPSTFLSFVNAKQV